MIDNRNPFRWSFSSFASGKISLINLPNHIHKRIVKDKNTIDKLCSFPVLVAIQKASYKSKIDFKAKNFVKIS